MRSGNPFKGLHLKKASELLEPALRKARQFSVPRKGRWFEYKREETIKKIKVLTDELVRQIRDLVSSYPSLDNIHEFYRAVVEVWVPPSNLKNILDSIWSTQFKLRKIAGRYIKKIDSFELGDTTEKKEYVERLMRIKKAAYGRLCSLVEDLDEDLSFLRKVTKQLANLPDYDPTSPAVVVAGPPNSGKSTLIKQVSNARVKTASYPFTTKRITFGHFDLDISDFISLRTQIVDTPGLFDHPLDERKDPELLALKAIRHLGDVIMILLDASITNPLGPEGQKRIYNTIRLFFKQKDYIVGINKLDIADKNVLNSLEQDLKRKGETYVKISLKEKRNLESLFKEIGNLLEGSRFLEALKPQYDFTEE